jgi:hypothetical protein
MPTRLERDRRQGSDIAIPDVFFEKAGNKFTQYEGRKVHDLLQEWQWE